MSEPKIAAKHPAQVNLEAGKTYAWCRCGLSQNQPFCDGSHKTTEFRPLVWQATESKEAWLCQCKHTRNAPYCDGTHKTI
jgi:CDGSH-type Zn-finger protein